MAEKTRIAWTDSTFNPWIGCTKVGLGCDHCYAEALMDKRWHRVSWEAASRASAPAPRTGANRCCGRGARGVRTDAWSPPSGLLRELG
ncbi:protein of unknown function (plasmid) [Denitratisoma oestradiolicum]|uniref:Uncharacterized protein n=1 Tax=Denitratisoma oestradiolicum TaxID=311182 RepID=A0A6S6Y710_9PROT|nr:protein of unknown function [Denitratisoma oestradiolicum]